MSDHFYLTLSSGVTKLPERMRLDGDYEVAISDFAYPHNWFNVNNGDDRYWIGAYNFVTNQFPFPKFFVKSGYYKDEETFVTSLTQQAAEAFANVSVKFTFVKHLHRIRMQIRNAEDTTVLLSSDLLEFLGFRRKMMMKKDVDYLAPMEFDLNRGLRLMYVYCDVAADVAVGDAMAPLMRVSNVHGEHGRNVRVTYPRPHYVPVRRREFDTIGISINNELGKPMPFDFGRTVITLHFRRRR
jgi:hypothetical protein